MTLVQFVHMSLHHQYWINKAFLDRLSGQILWANKSEKKCIFSSKFTITTNENYLQQLSLSVSFPAFSGLQPNCYRIHPGYSCSPGTPRLHAVRTLDKRTHSKESASQTSAS